MNATQIRQIIDYNDIMLENLFPHLKVSKMTPADIAKEVNEEEEATYYSNWSMDCFMNNKEIE